MPWLLWFMDNNWRLCGGASEYPQAPVLKAADDRLAETRSILDRYVTQRQHALEVMFLLLQ
jgi:hypothetical protein